MNKDVLLPAVAGFLLIVGSAAHAQAQNIPPLPKGEPYDENFCGLKCSKEDELKGILEATEANQVTTGNNESGRPLYCSGGSRGKIEASEAAVTGARRIMAMMYGSCDVLKLPVRQLLKKPNAVTKGFRRRDFPDGKPSYRREITDKAAILAQHPYLRDRQSKDCDDKKVCGNPKLRKNLSACEQFSCGALDYPPLYQYGARPSRENYSIRENWSSKFKGDYWKKAPGIDCSSFISSSLGFMGMKMAPSDESIATTDGYASGGIRNLARGSYVQKYKVYKGETCFDQVVDNGGLKPGDILANDGHVAMVDTVGADPFHNGKLTGADVEKWSEYLEDSHLVLKSKCQDKKLGDLLASPEQFVANQKCLTTMAVEICDNFHGRDVRPNYDITMIHSSGGENTNIGIQREQLASAFSPEGSLRGTIVLKAKVDCTLKLKQEWMARAKVNGDSNLSQWALQTGYDATLKARGGELMRHRSSDPRCMISPNDLPKVEGWECASCCDTTASYDSQMGGKVAQ